MPKIDWGEKWILPYQRASKAYSDGEIWTWLEKREVNGGFLKIAETRELRMEWLKGQLSNLQSSLKLQIFKSVLRLYV